MAAFDAKKRVERNEDGDHDDLISNQRGNEQGMLEM